MYGYATYSAYGGVYGGTDAEAAESEKGGGADPMLVLGIASAAAALGTGIAGAVASNRKPTIFEQQMEAARVAAERNYAMQQVQVQQQQTTQILPFVALAGVGVGVLLLGLVALKKRG